MMYIKDSQKCGSFFVYNSYNSYICTMDIKHTDTDYKIVKLLENEELIRNMIASRMSIELKRQKDAGKEFISDEEIDNLVDRIIREEKENPSNETIEYESFFDKVYNVLVNELTQGLKVELTMVNGNLLNELIDRIIKSENK